MARTHFKGKYGEKQWSEEINHGRKSVGEKTKPTKNILNFAPIHLKFGKRNSIN